MEQTLPLKFGRYRLDVLLGRGGMADVHKARDERLRRWVAIKHLHSDAAGDPEGRRALREARTAAQLGHPAIIRVFDVLEDDGDVWIVMELVDGPNLAELLRDGPLDVGLAVDYGRQVASGLAAAHAAGIVHRDLKTENVMVPPSGHVKILDFGLARQISPPPQVGEGDESTISLPGRIVGTPRAMSPEQARGLEVDARSDLFSFGVL
ncbi:MAG: serine/threonine protein kinase, partial [bacterium]|nr:serine/threonine protein kinase [bacterium]